MNYADFKVPSQSSAWNFLFESPSTSQTFSQSSSQLKGFTNTATGARLNHQQVKDFSIHLSTSLSKTYGLNEGEIISICSPNSLLFPVAMFGIMHDGAIPALSSPAYGMEEMVHVFRTVGCKFIMTSLASLDVVEKAATSLGIIKDKIFTLDGKIEGFRSLSDLIEEGNKIGRGQAPAFKIPRGKSNNEICALLCFSSGTTGLPKAVS